MGIGQELFLVRDDLRRRVRVQYALLGLVRKTGGGLGKQRDHMVEAGRASGRRAAQQRGISNQGSATAVRCGVETRQRVTPVHFNLGGISPITDSKHTLTEG